MKKVSMSDMVTRATEVAQAELNNSNPKRLGRVFGPVRGTDNGSREPVKSDQELIYDIMDNSESERV